MKRVAMVLVVLLLMAAVVGCSANTTGPKQGDNEGKVEYKKDLVIGFARKLITTYPAAASDTPHNMCSNLTHNSLVYVNQDTLKIEPGLATSWNIADDGVTYTFQLRDDVTFHNGEPLTADDVV